jgi:mannosyltransferase
VAVTLVAGHAVAVALARTRGDPHPLRWLVTCTAAGAGLVPLLVLGRGQQVDQLDWVPSPGLGAVAGLPGGITQAAAVGGLLAGLAAMGTVSTGRRGVALAACLLLPAGALLVGGLATPLWVPRYLVFTVPFGCVLAAAAVTSVRPRAGIAVVAVAAVLGAPAQAALRSTHEWPRSAPLDYRAAVRLITSNDRPGDGIVFSRREGGGKFLDTALAYYARADRPRDVLARRDPVSRAGLWAEECDRPDRCLAGTTRVWLMAAGERADPLRGLPGPTAAALRDGFHVDRTWLVPGLTVAVLSRTR